MRELFIYWRTPVGRAQEAERAVGDLQRSLRAACPGLEAALYRRADEQGAWATLMEVYRATPAVTDALQRRIVQEGNDALAPWIEGVRTVEVFALCEPR